MLYLYDKNTMAVSIEQFNATISITYRSLRKDRFVKVPAWISVILFSERSLKTERRKKHSQKCSLVLPNQSPHSADSLCQTSRPDCHQPLSRSTEHHCCHPPQQSLWSLIRILSEMTLPSPTLYLREKKLS